MKLLTLFITFIFFNSSFCQSTQFIVSGKVIDKGSKQALAGASVFAQNTTFGVATNADGNFNLKLPNGGYELVVTFTGYITKSIRISTSSNEKDIVIEMSPQEKTMQEVSIVASNEVKDGWEKYGQFFSENFIGKTQFSKQCVIQNHEVLKFYFSKKRNRLKVTAAEPLIVNNNALGYQIKFAIDSFTNEYNTNLSQFTGYPLFEEMQGTPEQQAVWKENRMKAYLGSQLDFMRSLYNKTLNENGFEVQFLVNNNNHEAALPLKNVYAALNYSKDDSTNTVEFKPNQKVMVVIYKDAEPEEAYQDSSNNKKDYQVSTLTIADGESIVIEENGYFFDQKDIITNDYWGFEKVGDLLPYDYIPSEEQ